MLTVKHVAQNGVETVYAAKGVQYVPGVRLGSPEDLPAGVTVHNLEGTMTHYGFDQAGGPDLPQTKVYVMNEHGKTVATYAL